MSWGMVFAGVDVVALKAGPPGGGNLTASPCFGGSLIESRYGETASRCSPVHLRHLFSSVVAISDSYHSFIAASLCYGTSRSVIRDIHPLCNIRGGEEKTLHLEAPCEVVEWHVCCHCHVLELATVQGILTLLNFFFCGLLVFGDVWFSLNFGSFHFPSFWFLVNNFYWRVLLSLWEVCIGCQKEV